MDSIRVLIVDDSAVFRSQIRSAIESIGGYTVVGTAPNGKVALERLAQLEVDLVTLDLEMPEMTGLEMLRVMREKGQTKKVIVFSSASKSGAQCTLDALNLGASDFIPKPSPQTASESQAHLSPAEKIRELLFHKLNALFPSKTAPKAPNLQVVPSLEKQFSSILWEVFQPKVVVIGSSTGGPTALDKIFSSLRGPIKCPILIAQHMPPVFTASLAERLGKVSGIPAAEAQHLELLQNNRIYIAPGNFHMSLVKSAEGIQISLDQSPLIHFVRPAVDPLFISAAEIFQKSCLGIILTGMGEDGKVGAEEVKRHGGAVIIQNKESCVVFGMPGAVFQAKAFDKISGLDEISTTLQEKVAA